jgi:hypothetical protein
MTSHSLTVRDVQVIGGKAYIRWSDNSEDEFDSKAAVTAFAQRTFEDKEAAKRFAKALALARYLRIDPNINNPNLIVNKTITLTDESNTVASIG